MSIEINNTLYSQTHGTLASQERPAAHGNSGDAPGPDTLPQTDRITLSRAATHLANFGSAGVDTGATDSQRVAAISKAVHSGNYVINPEQVAEKLQQFSANWQ